ncbi:unnamed protein product [Closterium sp. Yama58-4]|nr:unnamed protein product [Closterium sp. Yama58-4]
MGCASFLQDVLLDGNSPPFFCQDFQQQQQQQQQQQRAEGVGSAGLVFGGLSFDECSAVFFSPNARCCRRAASLDLSSVTSPPPPQATSVFANAAAFIAEFPVSHESSPIAASPIAAAPNSALRRVLKRPRDDSSKLGLQHRHQSVAEQFQQQGESSVVQAADEALLEELLQEEHRQQQGGARSRAQRVLWPRVGSEGALPDDVLLGCSSDDPAFIQHPALPAPPPSQLHTALPAPMPPEVAAALPGSAPCIGDFTVHRGEWLRVGSESALPDGVLLRFCCEDPAFTQRAALSAPPPPPTQPLAAPMPSPLAGLPGPAVDSTSRCLTAMLAGSACGIQEQEYVDACVNVLSNINNTDNSDNSLNTGMHSDKDSGALFLDTPMAHVLLGGSPLAVPLASGPHAEGPAVPRAAATDLPEWAEEQGRSREGGAEWHRQQQYFTLEGILAQWKPCQYLELDRMLSLPPHQPPLHSQPSPQLRLRPLLQLPTPAPWLSVPCQHGRAPTNTIHMVARHLERLHSQIL